MLGAQRGLERTAHSHDFARRRWGRGWDTVAARPDETESSAGRRLCRGAVSIPRRQRGADRGDEGTEARLRLGREGRRLETARRARWQLAQGQRADALSLGGGLRARGSVRARARRAPARGDLGRALGNAGVVPARREGSQSARLRARAARARPRAGQAGATRGRRPQRSGVPSCAWVCRRAGAQPSTKETPAASPTRIGCRWCCATASTSGLA